MTFDLSTSSIVSIRRYPYCIVLYENYVYLAATALKVINGTAKFLDFSLRNEFSIEK